jgi:hypothetical protein
MFSNTNKDCTTVKQRFLLGKSPDQSLCEDVIVESEHFIAVIDGVTSKSDKLFDGMKGGRYAALLVRDAILALDPKSNAVDALKCLDRAIAQKCPVDNVEPQDRIQACAVIYSKYRKEVWSYGDCNLMIGDRVYYHSKLIDEVLSNLRAYLIALKLKEGATVESLMEKDDAREAILPFMKKQMLFANCDGPFGYPVIDGSGINENFIKIYKAEPGEQVVLASDGYPKLFDSLEESEKYLERVLKNDPLACFENIQTKMIVGGNNSFDDRAYISFLVN